MCNKKVLITILGSAVFINCMQPINTFAKNTFSRENITDSIAEQNDVTEFSIGFNNEIRESVNNNIVKTYDGNLNNGRSTTPKISMTSPSKDQLYIKNRPINISWKFTDSTSTKPKETTISVKNTKTLEVKKYTIKENLDYYIMPSEGEYEISIKSVNHNNVGSNTEKRTVRVHSFKESGKVLTKDIVTEGKITKAKIAYKSDVPSSTSISGRIYYEKKTTGAFNYDKYITFSIDGDRNESDILSIPKATSSLRVEYTLLRTGSNKNITPIVEEITVFAR